MDLLGTIKYCINGNKEMRADGENIILNSKAYKGDSITNFKSSNGFVQLKDIFFAINEHIKKPSLKYSDYYREAKEKGFTCLNSLELNSLVNYLKGVNKDSEYIDKSVLTTSAAVELQPEVEPQQTKPVIDRILESQISTIDTNNMLKGNDDLKEVVSYYDHISRAIASAPPSKTQEKTNAQWKEHLQMDNINLDLEGSLEQQRPKRQKLNPSTTSSSTASSSSSINNTANIVPIILFPAPELGLVTLKNAKKLLIENQFVSPDEARIEKYTNEIIITRKQKDKERTFKLVDSPLVLKRGDWDNVIAVVTCGETWQFEDYVWKNPVDVFSDRAGFYFNWNTEPAPPAVKGWKVKIISINRNSRSSDAQVSQQFWKDIDHILTVRGF